MIKSVLPTPTWGAYFKTRIVLIFWRSLNIVLRTSQFLLYKKIKAPKRILILRTGSLGDSICAIPSIAAIRSKFPLATIDILSNTGLKSLASIKSILNPELYDNYIDYLGLSKMNLLSRLQKENYDAIIQLGQTQAPFRSLLRDMLFFRFGVGIPTGFGWEFSSVRFFKKTQEKYIEYYGEIERLLYILKQNGIQSNGKLDFSYNISDMDIEIVEASISTIRSQRNLPMISMVIGAKRPQNRWPLAYFKEVAKHFSPKYNLIVIGGPEDKAMADNLLDVEGVFNLCGKFTPVQSGVAVQRSILCISNDTGPMHLAYSFGVPVIALFSSRDFPNKWYPPANGKNTVFRNFNVPCSLCLSEDCTNNICMQGISSKSVIQAAEQYLQQKTAQIA